MILAPATIPTIPGLQAALDAKAPTANPAFTGALTAAAGVLVNPAPNQITQTWNDAADTFTAFQVNITDTASAEPSLLADFMVNGGRKFAIRKDGGISTIGNFTFYTGSTLRAYFQSSNGKFNIIGNVNVDGSEGIAFRQNSSYALALAAASASVLELNNGTAGQIATLRAKLRLETDAAPASATDAGVAGETRWDASFLYVCTAANTWKRTALATW